MAQLQTDLKALHYTQQLYGALNCGAWADPAPANAVKGPPMSWSELIRKFKKHCVERHITAELALQTQSLSLLLLSSEVDAKILRPEDLDGDGTSPFDSLELGHECNLAPERVEEARLGFASLELLNDTEEERDSTLFTRAYYAYALKKYKECLALLNPMNFDENPPAKTVGSSQMTKEIQKEPSSSSTITSLLNIPPSEKSGSSAGTGGTHLTWTGSIASVDVDERGRRMWRLVEVIRGRCLQGMSMEKLHHSQEALSTYLAALPILKSLRSAGSTPALNTDKPDLSFVKYRELWRWAERLLWRASVLSSKYSSVATALGVFQTYLTHSQFYPPTFRPAHRHVVTSLHLHALLRSYPGNINGLDGVPLVIPGQTKLSWITEARTLLGEYRGVLGKTTNFPRAGERNALVEEFCDAVYGVWERTGRGETGWAIDLLWWATRMTFHSHRIFRHLFRLLHASGDHELAKRTFKLYVQLVTKSRQASLSEVESTIRRRRTFDHLDDDLDPVGDTAMADIEPPDESSADSDRRFVEALVSGARMLARLDGEVDDAKWAREVLDTARGIVGGNKWLGGDRAVKAKLCVAEGVVDSVIAVREQDPSTRPYLLKQALNSLASAVNLNPDSADAYYHLSLALLQAGPTRDLEGAIRAARHAVELESNEVRYWHLLGLALSADGQLVQAREVLEIGEALETEEEAEEPVATGTSGISQNEGVSRFDRGQTESPQDIETLLQPEAKKVPSPSAMLLPVLDHPPPNKEDLFEYGLQLRVTLLALIERTDGAEVASVKWVEVFAWFAERGGWAKPAEERRASFDLPPIQTIPPVEGIQERDGTISSTSLPILVVTGTQSQSATHLPSGGLPTTVIPPAPNPSNGSSESLHTIRLSNDKDEEHSISTRTKQAQRKIKEQIKEQVNKRQSQIQTISRKLGKKESLRGQMARAASTPDLGVMLGETHRLYQASSIHSRQRMSPRESYIGTGLPTMAPTPPQISLSDIVGKRTTREKRLIADLWLTSAATFRRMGKLEQARAAIQEAEALDEGHPGVWVQLGLYFVDNGEISHAIAAFHKALVIDPDHIPAVVHLAQQYLNPAIGQTTAIAGGETESRRGAVDLAAGMLSSFTKGPGWDVPEAWYLLAKAVSLQGRKERQRECLTYALGLVEGKPIRDIRVALGYAL